MKKKQHGGRIHGGRRPGAGRPAGSKKKQPTKVMRIPESLVPQVINLVEGDLKTRLPLYACKVSAGFPSPGDDYLEDEVSLQQLVIKQPAATFFVRCQGDSMIGAGIHDNDVLVVDRSEEAINGKIIVAVLNGELTVKRLLKKDHKVWLKAENPAYANIPVTGDDNFRIWGVVTCVLHHV